MENERLYNTVLLEYEIHLISNEFGLNDIDDKIESVNDNIEIYIQNAKESLKESATSAEHPSPILLSYVGCKLFNLSKTNLAKDVFYKIIRNDVNYPGKYFGSKIMLNSVGQAFMELATKYEFESKEVSYKLTSLAYLYLSKSINELSLVNGESYDSYHSRASLFWSKKNENAILKIIMNYIPGSIYHVFPICDYYNSSIQHNTQYNEFKLANTIHNWLDDMVVGGKEASDYTLEEMSKLGYDKHKILYSLILADYYKGKFNISQRELIDAIQPLNVRIEEDEKNIVPKNNNNEDGVSSTNRIIEYFKDKPFGTEPPVMSFFSYLPPLDRVIILKEIFEFQKNISVIDKLSMAYLKNGDYDKAIFFIKNNCNKSTSIQLLNKINLLQETLVKSNRTILETLDLIHTNLKDSLSHPFVKLLMNYCEVRSRSEYLEVEPKDDFYKNDQLLKPINDSTVIKSSSNLSTNYIFIAILVLALFTFFVSTVIYFYESKKTIHSKDVGQVTPVFDLKDKTVSAVNSIREIDSSTSSSIENINSQSSDINSAINQSQLDLSETELLIVKVYNSNYSVDKNMPRFIKKELRRANNKMRLTEVKLIIKKLEHLKLLVN